MLFDVLLDDRQRRATHAGDEAEREHPEAFYAGLRLVAIDGSCFELPDEADNAAQFGYPGSRTSVSGHAGYPQARCVVLVECATHAILGANIGPYRSGEWELCTALLPRLGPGMLCMADRGFNGIEQWRQASASGAELLWRCSDTRELPVPHDRRARTRTPPRANMTCGTYP